MNAVYSALDIIKQAFHQHLNRELIKKQDRYHLLEIIRQLRDDHPTMGCRDMYYKLCPESMGRDAFEAFCKEEGLSSKRYRSPHRTTDSSGVIRFDDLTKDLKLTGINQLWVSDITYFEVRNKFYYLTFVIDAWSRRIIGHQASKRLLTESTTLPALEMAIRSRRGNDVSSVIFHSDGGGQYYSKDFLAITKKQNITNSMCEYAWDNGKAERINGVIKNNYLIHRDINSFEELKKEVDRTVKLYNEDKPHKSLQRKTPIEYEILYLSRMGKSNADQSTTECENYKSAGRYSPAGCREKSSASHITPEYNHDKSTKETVNVI